jgi:ketosteroid isomerase-like protein
MRSIKTLGKEKPPHLSLGSVAAAANNRQMRRTSFLILAALAFAGVFARAETPVEAVRAMVDAEKKFYLTGQTQGTRAGFLAFLADDAIVFQQGPVNGKEAWSKRAETGLDLVWEPTFAVIARSGDIGYDTGPAKWRAKKSEEKFTGHGQFISVWKKQKDGSWKVALDCGIENPEPTGKPEALRTVAPADPAKSLDAEAVGKIWTGTQRDFAEAAKTDSTAATLEFASDDLRVYRDGHFPSVGKGPARSLLSESTGKTSFELLGGILSSSADLGYSYGKYSSVREKGTEQGHYLHIWQTDKARIWKLVLDWQQPLP